MHSLRIVGYEAVWQGERSWNGVAILARNNAPVLTRSTLPRDPSDQQARYIEAAVQRVLVTCIYLPNGNPQPGPKFTYKLAWFDRLIHHAAELIAAGIPVVLAETITLRRATKTSIPQDLSTKTRLYNQKAEKPLRACSRRAGRVAKTVPYRAALDLLGLPS